MLTGFSLWDVNWLQAVGFELVSGCGMLTGFRLWDLNWFQAVGCELVSEDTFFGIINKTAKTQLSLE
jgi:hypothetical protein